MSQNTFNRPDTIFGICEALGQDLGFNAQWLRLALALGVFWSPTIMLTTYLLLGVAVLAARLLTPMRTPVKVPTAPVVADNDQSEIVLARAA